MALVLANPQQLEPDISLVQAINNFEQILNDEQKRQFRSEGPPDASAALNVTALIDQECNQKRRQCMGPRVMMLLESVQQFSQAADTFVSARPQIAALVWGGVKLTLLAANNISSYFDKVSTLLMRIGKQCPRIQALGSLYPSEGLRRAWCDYIATVLRLCRHIIETLQKPAYSQLTKAFFLPFNAHFQSYEDEITLSSQAVRDEASLASKEAQRMEHALQARERGENTKSRHLLRKLWDDSSRTNNIHQKSLIENHMRNLERTKLRFLDSLSTYDYQRSYRRIRKECMPGTSQWICQDPIFQEWLKGPTKTLCFTGKLGSGKSVSCTSVITHLPQALSPSDITSYFFCRFDDQESLRAQTIIGTIFRQFADRLPPDAFKELKGERKSTFATIEAVKTVLDPKQKYFIVLDGLDECEKAQSEEVVEHLQDLLTWSNLDVKLFWTCRSLIASWFPKRLLVQQQISSESAGNQAKVNSDIQKFVRNVLEDWQEDEEFPLQQNISSMVQDRLGRKTHGMFLWAKLQLETIKEELTNDRILSALDDLPENLLEIFRRVLLPQAQKDNEGIGRRIFRWTAVAKRPLTVEELREAISIRPLQKAWDPNTLINNMSKAISYCSNLVLIDEEHNTVHFAHSSVRQFFVSAAVDDRLRDYSINLEEADMDVGASCVTYLNLPMFNTQVSRIDKQSVNPTEVVSTVIANSLPSGRIANRLAKSLVRREDKSGGSVHRLLEETAGADEESRRRNFLKQYAFRAYAECFWLDHTAQGLNPDSNEMWGLFRHLIEEAEWRNTLCNTPWTSRDWTECSDATVDWIVAQCHISLFRLNCKDFATIPEKNLEKRLVNDFASTGDTKVFALLSKLGLITQPLLDSALRAAAKSGQSSFVGSLLSGGASYGAEDENGRTALSYAAKEGRAAVVDMLTQAGANVDHRDRLGSTALCQAAGQGCTDAVDSLLRAGADVDYQYQDRTVLSIAAKAGHGDIVTRLLQAGADPNNHHGEYGWTTLLHAVSQGHASIVESLLRAGADPNNLSNHSKTALDIAVYTGYTNMVEMVEMLLEAGADVNHQDINGKTALLLAAGQGHTNVVESLLQARANVNHQDINGKTALLLAAGKGHTNVVESLLQARANINHQNINGKTALLLAAGEGHMNVVKRLLEAGADVNHQNKNSKTALFHAASYGHMEVVERLLQAGADIHHQGKNTGQTILFFAAGKGHMNVVERLLQAGADVNHQDEYGQAALFSAAREGHTNVVERLLQAGADINHQNKNGKTALFHAADKGHRKLVETLLQAGADVNLQDMDGHTALFYSEYGSAVEDLLLKAGAK